MIRLPLFAAASVSLLCLIAPAHAAEKTRKEHALPKDPKAAVIVLEYQGGFTPPRTNSEPALTIQAGGTVILGAPFGLSQRIETKIDQKQLQELLRFVLDEQQMAKFDAARVRAQQQQGGRPSLRVADAATTVLRVQADGKQYEAKYYALGMMASQYPAIKELARFESARKRLERFRGEIYAGGKQGVAKYLGLANKQLKAGNPQVPPLTAENLQTASRSAIGRMFVSFFRKEQLDNGTLRYTSANIKIPADGKMQINTNVTVRPAK